jgi:peptidyl-prolyl cis-trans isomerase A (cyclophilin A)
MDSHHIADCGFRIADSALWIGDCGPGLRYDRGMSTFARFDTTEGSFTVRFFDDEVPQTVANFVGLAEGTKPWTDPRTGEQKQSPFYDGIVFHRVIDGFMIQGGDPLGRGYGGPGYKFSDEFHPTLRHDRAGILSMANSGPNTNGSQFFITLGPTPHLDNRHSVFGVVEDGMETVQKIGKVRTGAQDRPVNDVVINKVTIERK